MAASTKHLSWLSEIAKAAAEQGVDLPAFARLGMGTARSQTTPAGRFATLKYRLAPAAETPPDPMEWTLWETRADMPHAVAAFRQPLRPRPENVNFVLAVLKRWLADGAAPDEIKVSVDAACHAHAVP